MERPVPELCDWVRNNNEAAPTMRCAILDVVSRFPSILQQLWSACDARMQKGTTKVRRNQGWLLLWERRRRRSVMVRLCDRWSSRLLEDWAAKGEGTKLLRDLVATAVANGQCSPHAVGRWRTQLERVLLTAQADTYLRALGSRVAERPAAEPPLLLAE